MVAVALFVGFVFGALAVIVVEVVGVLFLIQILGEKEQEQKQEQEEVKVAKSAKEEQELQFSFPNKQGWVWVLERQKTPKALQSPEKNLRQQKRKIEAFEVTPVKKHASIKDKLLLITEPDGTLTKINLPGCVIEAVSAAYLPARKWAKKYPVKVENKSSEIYHGNKLFYMYFETSCEKEAWCKSLRLASCDDKEKVLWFYKLRSEFQSYLTSLNVEYPSFLKPSIGYNPETGDKTLKVDGSSSRVRHFLKRLAKKAPKTSKDDKKTSDNSVVGSSKSMHATEEKIIQAMIPNSVTQSSDADSNDKLSSDDGSLCVNLLISRLFFDAKSNMELRNLMQAHIQRMLSAARTPSFVGEIICTSVDPGIIPPYINSMRVVPSDVQEVVAVELDIEYCGGAVLDITTRLEVQELENSNSNSKSVDDVDDVTTDLIEGVEHIGEQMNLNEQKNEAMEHKDDEKRNIEETKSTKGNEQTSTALPKWKSVINSVAKQVSQVPLSLAIRVTALRGTLRLQIKPPPSDQVWFGFTSMPDVDFRLESAVGERKITSGHIAMFIINKFKAAIRETMVLPNSESTTVPFMLAEKNDWLPQNAAPFIWTNPEILTNTEPPITHEPHPPQQHPDETPQQEVSPSTGTSPTTGTTTPEDKTLSSNHSDDDENGTENNEKTPLLESKEHATRTGEESPESEKALVLQGSTSRGEEENSGRFEVEDGSKLKRSGTRAKMMGFGKKMGEKLEEKRRNIEEKGRHMVEKMRGPAPAPAPAPSPAPAPEPAPGSGPGPGPGGV